MASLTTSYSEITNGQLSTLTDQRVRNRIKRALMFAHLYTRASLGAVYAITLGVSQRRHRGLLADIARHFGYDYHSGVKPRLTRMRVADVVDSSRPIRLLEIEAMNGNVSLLELTVLASAAARRDVQTIFEIGTFNGRTTVNLAANAQRARVYTLDLPVTSGSDTSLRAEPADRAYMPNGRAAAFDGAAEAQRITQLRGDSARFDFTPFMGMIDLCFVDGAHSYEYVINDSLRALDLMHRGGVIFWHDYGVWSGVTQALDELTQSDRRFSALQWIEGTSLVRLVVTE